MVRPPRIRTPRIVNPGAGRWYAAFFLGVVLGGVGWFGFDYGREWAGLAATHAGRTVRRLRDAVAALEQERDRLRLDVAALERAAQVDREAARLSQANLKSFQEEKLALERDVEFLRNLLDEEASGALRIQDFELVQESGERRFGYRFTLTQLKEGFGVSEGRVYLSVLGSERGEARVIPLEKLSEEHLGSHKMRFRHFQKVQGVIRLPEGFAPDQVVVEVKPKTKRLTPVREEFEWVSGG